MKNNFEYLIEHVEPDEFSRWEEVDLEICACTDLGFKVAINDEYAGLVYANQVYEQYHEGQKLKGYITGFGKMDGLMFPFNPIKVGMCIRLSIRSSITLRQWEGNPNLGTKALPKILGRNFR